MNARIRAELHDLGVTHIMEVASVASGGVVGVRYDQDDLVAALRERCDCSVRYTRPYV